MPIFEYECAKCGIFDVLQVAGEKPLKFCPTCAKKKKKSKVTKVVSSPAFHLKGTGWYKTDYASPSNSKSKSGTEEKPSSSVKEASTDSPKPDSKKKESSSAKESKATSSKD